MKAILVPYARPGECVWSEDLFPNRSVAALPVCGKPIIAYCLDEMSRRGVTDAMVIDRRYDRRLAAFIGDGSKWGMKVIYVGGEENGDEADIRRRNSAFIGGDELVLVSGVSVAGTAIRSLRDYFEINLSLLRDHRDCVIPGYSAEAGVYVGSDVVIRPGADVKGPVCLGDGVQIGRGAKILSGSVLGEGCVVDRGAKIGESVVFAGTYVGKHVEFVRKIVAGSRVIDPDSGAYVDLEDEGISQSVDSGLDVLPANLAELSERRYTGAGDPATENVLRETLRDIARDIAALDLPKLEGVYLGGGYGRGEGGAPLFNDLDFFPLVRDVTESEREDIRVALDTLGVAWGFRLGIHVDFCRPKTHADFRRDERRVMVQEFIRGNVPVYGRSESLGFLTEYPPEEIPASEALRTLVNRGMGLYLARDSVEPGFASRNINKAVLGAGDAVLMAERRYRWTATERERLLGNPEYSRAVALKFRPTGEAAVEWKTARLYWQMAVEKVMSARSREIECFSIRQGVRYILRRHRLGSVFEFGTDPLLRILLPLQQAITAGTKIDAETMKDWEVFN